MIEFFFRLLYSWPYNFFKKLNIFLDKKQSKFQSILIALSGNSNDYKSVQIAKNLIEKKSGTLTFVHVLEIYLKTPLDAEIKEQTIPFKKATLNSFQSLTIISVVCIAPVARPRTTMEDD